jgi:hypothetical protein
VADEAAWFSKDMAPGERRRLGQSLESLFAEQDTPRDAAAFTRPSVNGNNDTVLVSPIGARVAQLAGEEGWTREALPATRGWRVLAGHSDGLLWFGLSA